MHTFFELPEDSFPKLTYVGINQVTEPWKHFRRITEESIVYFLLSGDMFLTEDQISYHLKPGDFLLLEAGKEHFGYQESLCQYAFFHFAPLSAGIYEEADFPLQQDRIRKALEMNFQESPFSADLYQKLTLLLPKYFHVEQPDMLHQIHRLIQDAVVYSQSRHMHYKLLVSCRFTEMLSLISQSWMDSVYLNSQMDISSSMYEKTNEILDFLHSSYHRKISGKLLEDTFSMNFDYMNRIFKKRTGTTIFAYLNNLRLEQAKQLLATTQLSLEEIASHTGFSDEFYFNRFFKKRTMITPARYRRQWISSCVLPQNQ